MRLLNRHIAQLMVFVFMVAGVICSCDKNSDLVLPEGKMEDVLYDYHLLNGIVKTSHIDSTTTKQYVEALYRKHGITQAEFDSSMVYYMRHADKMEGIYKHLSSRIEAEANRNGIEGRGDQMFTDNQNGDTANIWNKEKTHIFFAHVPYNIMQYSFKADTTFKAGDRFIMNFDADFLFQDGIRNGLAVMLVKFATDSVVTRTVSISTTGNRRLQIDDSDRLGVKEVKGFFMLRPGNSPSDRNSSTLRMMMLKNIQLLKMHTKEIVKQEIDTIQNEKTDSIVHHPDTMPVRSIGMHKLHSR